MRAPAAALRSGWNCTPASVPDSIAATIGPLWSVVATTTSASLGSTA